MFGRLSELFWSIVSFWEVTECFCERLRKEMQRKRGMWLIFRRTLKVSLPVIICGVANVLVSHLFPPEAGFGFGIGFAIASIGWCITSYLLAKSVAEGEE